MIYFNHKVGGSGQASGLQCYWLGRTKEQITDLYVTALLLTFSKVGLGLLSTTATWKNHYIHFHPFYHELALELLELSGLD